MGVTQTGLVLSVGGGPALLPIPRPTWAIWDRLLIGCRLKPQSKVVKSSSAAPTAANGWPPELNRRVPVSAGTAKRAEPSAGIDPRLPDVVCVSKLTVMATVLGL